MRGRIERMLHTPLCASYCPLRTLRPCVVLRTHACHCARPQASCASPSISKGKTVAGNPQTIGSSFPPTSSFPSSLASHSDTPVPTKHFPIVYQSRKPMATYKKVTKRHFALCFSKGQATTTTHTKQWKEKTFKRWLLTMDRACARLALLVMVCNPPFLSASFSPFIIIIIIVMAYSFHPLNHH